MSYINAKKVLPEHLIDLIQDYFEGDYLYIPKKETSKKSWGDNTTTKAELACRNEAIYKDAQNGMTTEALASQYFLSVKSIQRILSQYQKKSQSA